MRPCKSGKNFPSAPRKCELSVGLLILLLSASSIPRLHAQQKSAPNTTAAPKSVTANLSIAPNLKVELAKFKPVRMPFDTSHLNPKEIQMVGKLVEACRYLESIYWRQSDPEGLKLYSRLAASRDPKDTAVRRFLRINGSQFDLINDNKPFVGTAPWPPGRGFFPADLTHEELDRYVAAHPDQKDSLYDPFTVVRRKGDGLEA